MPQRTQLPFKIVDTIGYDPAAKDLSVEVSKAKAANADFLLLVCRLQDSIILRREMVKQRWQPMGIVSPGSPGMSAPASHPGPTSTSCSPNRSRRSLFRLRARPCSS